MPILNEHYLPPRFFKNAHMQTIYPSLCRRVKGIAYQRQRIDTPDGDFLDLDWSVIERTKKPSVAIIAHGLEGHSRRSYMLGMAKAFNSIGFDSVCWNGRGCSGERNRTLAFTHSGCTEDLHCVIENVLKKNFYQNLVLVGFSLGGNITLKYLGKGEHGVSPLIRAAIAISVPCVLSACSEKLALPENRIYMKRFLIMLKEKAHFKAEIDPVNFSLDNYATFKTFRDYDDRFTAPIHGFKDAQEYWRKSSSKQFLPSIDRPTLILTAQNDPFLTPECLPVDEARGNQNLYVCIPESGGHVGFPQFHEDGLYWSERQATRFVREHAQ